MSFPDFRVDFVVIGSVGREMARWMSRVTIVWSIMAAVAGTLGSIHLITWCQDRKAWANLAFSVTCLAMAAIATVELGLMDTSSPARFGELIRWGHIPLLGLQVGVVGFVAASFGTAKRRLAQAAIGARLVCLLANFTTGLNLNYSAIHALKRVRLLGEPVWVVADGVPNPWRGLGELSSILLLVFVVDASVRLWRKGNPEKRPRALTVGGSIVLFIVVAAVDSALINRGVLATPYFISLPFLPVFLTMGFELSRDLFRASRLAEDLRENAESMTLAASAAQIALWRWDIVKDIIWVSPNGRAFYNIAAGAPINRQRFLETLHPADREAVRQAMNGAMSGDGSYQAEYRVVRAEGDLRWIAARGKVEFDSERNPLRIRGVSLDVTERRAAEMEANQSRAELAHLARVTTLSELSVSLAHELNQPLAIILSNAQAAQRLIAKSPPDVAEVAEILTDIVSEDRRAGEVIKRLRGLFKRGETTLTLLSLNEIIDDVLHLARSDLAGRGVTVVRNPLVDLPPVNADRVQLQQVVLNLVLNAADAMSTNAPANRRLDLATSLGDKTVRISVGDEGLGLPENVETLFAPFFTTKPHGLGMGLPICRSIATAHGGRLWAEPNAPRGAVFHLELPL